MSYMFEGAPPPPPEAQRHRGTGTGTAPGAPPVAAGLLPTAPRIRRRFSPQSPRSLLGLSDRVAAGLPPPAAPGPAVRPVAERRVFS